MAHSKRISTRLANAVEVMTRKSPTCPSQYQRAAQQQDPRRAQRPQGKARFPPHLEAAILKQSRQDGCGCSRPVAEFTQSPGCRHAHLGISAAEKPCERVD